MLWTLLTGKVHNKVHVREFVARSKVPAEEASLVQHAEVFSGGGSVEPGKWWILVLVVLVQRRQWLSCLKIFTNDHRCRM